MSLFRYNTFSDEGSKGYDELTVFQAEPLVWKSAECDVEGNDQYHPIDQLDFQHERRVLTKSLEEAEENGVKIRLAFETATTGRLGAFLATSKAQVLHFSCHGHSQYLALEDGLGGAHLLIPEELREFVASGNKSLRFVFLGACCSKNAGEAFVKAGVPHVLCCETHEYISDSAAIEFCRHFYPALASGKTLKDSFRLGQQAVRLSPSVPDAMQEMEKFLLLPENGDHNVTIFFKRCQPSATSLATRRPLFSRLNLPHPPRVFVGRGLVMYKVLQKIRSCDFIKLKGCVGHGKRSLAAAVSHYISAREHSFSIDEIIWLPFVNLLPQGKLSSSLYDLCKIMQDKSSSSGLSQNDDYAHLRREIFESLAGTSVLFFIDTEPFIRNKESLCTFLDDLFTWIRHVKVVLICHDDLDIAIKQNLLEDEITVDSLDFESAVFLFGNISRHVSEKRHPLARTAREFAKLAAQPGQDKFMSSHKRREILKAVGDGIPSRLHKMAQQMTLHDFSNLIEFARKSNEEVEGLSLALTTSEERDADDSPIVRNSKFGKLYSSLRLIVPVLIPLVVIVSLKRRDTKIQKLTLPQQVPISPSIPTAWKLCTEVLEMAKRQVSCFMMMQWK